MGFHKIWTIQEVMPKDNRYFSSEYKIKKRRQKLLIWYQ